MNRKDSEDLVRVGPGTIMGELMRQYWIPAAMSSELKARRRPDAADAARREADRLPRQLRAGRGHGPQMPAPLRVAVPRPQRGERHTLRLSRLEVRRRRQLRRYAEPRRHRTSRTASRPRPTRSPSATASSGSIWASAQRRRRCRRSRRPCCRRARCTISFVQRECNWLQALEGDIDTSHFGFLHAGGIDPDDVPEDSLFRFTVTNRAPEYHVTDTDCRHDVRRLPRGRAGPDLLALRQFHAAVLDADAAGQVHRAPAQPRLGPDGRQSHDVRQPDVAAPPALARPGQAAAARCPAFSAPSTICRTRPTGTAAGGSRATRERLADRPRGASDGGNLHRHRGHPRAGPGGDREHGAGHRPPVRASGAVRPDDHGDPPPAAGGGPRLGRARHRAARRRRARSHVPGAQRRLRRCERSRTAVALIDQALQQCLRPASPMRHADEAAVAS